MDKRSYCDLVDCRISTEVNMLYKFDFKIDPLDLFGICCSLDFGSFIIPVRDSINFIGISGRNFNSEKYLNKVCPFKLVEESIENMDFLIDIVCNGELVMANVDRFYLDYLHIKKSHFGMHTILIKGYDKEKDKFLVSDILSEKLEYINKENLITAMTSNIDYCPPDGKWYYAKREDKADRYNISFHNLILKQSIYMLNKEGPISQIRQLRLYLFKMLCKQLKDKKLKKYIRYQINFLSQIIHDQEGSSSLYRWQYYHYILNNSRKENVIISKKLNQRMNLEIIEWNKLSNLYLSGKYTPYTGIYFILKLYKIEKLEKKIFSELVNIAKEETYDEKNTCNK